jgi:3-oxoacyl-[acyl-carrier protein] reductase
MIFDKKVVLVTGGAQGIGISIGSAFLEKGARVVLNDRTPEMVEAGISRLGGPQARLFGRSADVIRGEEVNGLINEAVQTFGCLDIVINNAGLYPVTPVLEMPEEEWDAVLGVNLKGTFLVSQAAARQMVRQGHGGQIVNISSGSYMTGRLGCAHYCASKAGVVLFTRVLAMELAMHKIRVNAIAPGLIDNPESLTPVTPEYAAATSPLIPWGRLGRPRDVANAVIMLCSDDAEYITGTVLSVDGGLSAGRFTPQRK